MAEIRFQYWTGGNPSSTLASKGRLHKFHVRCPSNSLGPNMNYNRSLCRSTSSPSRYMYIPIHALLFPSLFSTFRRQGGGVTRDYTIFIITSFRSLRIHVCVRTTNEYRPPSETLRTLLYSSVDLVVSCPCTHVTRFLQRFRSHAVTSIRHLRLRALVSILEVLASVITVKRGPI